MAAEGLNAYYMDIITVNKADWVKQGEYYYYSITNSLYNKVSVINTVDTGTNTSIHIDIIYVKNNSIKLKSTEKSDITVYVLYQDINKTPSSNSSNNAIIVPVTILASGWNNDKYNISNENISSDSVLALNPNSDKTTVEMYDQVVAAKLSGIVQNNLLVLYALGTVPTVDIICDLVIQQ